MSLGKLIFTIFAPLAAAISYFLALWLLPASSFDLLNSERGIIELGTVALFTLAGIGGLFIAFTSKAGWPTAYRALFFLYGVAALAVALEEIDYGQHLLQWETSAWFLEHNYQKEMNWHNLANNKPSHLLIILASMAFAVGAVVLPLIALFRGDSYRTGDWTYYLLPRLELAVAVMLAEVVMLSRILTQSFFPDDGARLWLATEVKDEMREFFWSLAALLYVLVIRQRIAPPGAARSATLSPTPAAPRAKAHAGIA